MEYFSPEEEAAYQNFHKQIKLREGSYEVGLPWQVNAYDLPTNNQLARNRLESNLIKLRQNVEHLQSFEQTLRAKLYKITLA